MSGKKRVHPKVKESIHPRNKHRSRYDLKSLVKSCPELGDFVGVNKYGDESIDFFDPDAVYFLNRALLIHYYGIDYWDIPEGYLCPPIPGRADYIHNVADLLAENNGGKVPTGEKIRCLDIGVGANCVYPIIGVAEYGWSFVGSDIDEKAVESAKAIVKNNPSLKNKVEIRLQENPDNIFNGLIAKGEKFDICICNPPFHASFEEAQRGTMRKMKNLGRDKKQISVSNFGGRSNELWCKGGQERFVSNMIYQSQIHHNACLWYSTLISKESDLKKTYALLKKAKVNKVKTIEMGQGNKKSRIVAWTFMSEKARKFWNQKTF